MFLRVNYGKFAIHICGAGDVILYLIIIIPHPLRQQLNCF